MSAKNVLVTGATGFLGSQLVNRLVAENHSVTVIDRSPNAPIQDGKIHRILGSLEEVVTDSLFEISRFDWVFHLAGSASVPNSIKNPANDFESLKALFALLEALRRVESSPRPKLIFPSSGAVYGQPATMPISEDCPTNPLSPYGVGKLAAEEYIRVYSQLYGIPTVRLRLFSVYGPGLTKQVIYDLMCKLTKNAHEIEILGDGQQQRDFVYIDDVIDCMLMAASLKSEPGVSPVYNVASGSSQRIIDLAQQLAKCMKVEPRIHCTEEIQSGEAHSWLVDISRVKSIGFCPSVSFEDGLKRVVAWYQSTLATSHS